MTLMELREQQAELFASLDDVPGTGVVGEPDERAGSARNDWAMSTTVIQSNRKILVRARWHNRQASRSRTLNLN
jgi:hypothetical protein